MHLVGIDENKVARGQPIGSVAHMNVHLSLHGHDKLQGLMPVPADVADPVQEKFDGQLFGEVDDFMTELQDQALLDG